MDMHLSSDLVTNRLPHYGDKPRPLRDWLALVTVTAILLIVSMAWNAWFFVRMTRGEAVNAEPDTALAPSTTVLEDAKKAFRERAEEEERYRADYLFIDPSK